MQHNKKLYSEQALATQCSKLYLQALCSQKLDPEPNLSTHKKNHQQNNLYLILLLLLLLLLQSHSFPPFLHNPSNTKPWGFFFPLQNQKPKPPKLFSLRNPKRIPKVRNQKELQPCSVRISLLLLLLLFRKIIPLRADITKSLLPHKTICPRALASFFPRRAGSPDQQYTKRHSFYLPVLFFHFDTGKKISPLIRPQSVQRVKCQTESP